MGLGVTLRQAGGGVVRLLLIRKYTNKQTERQGHRNEEHQTNKESPFQKFSHRNVEIIISAYYVP